MFLLLANFRGQPIEVYIVTLLRDNTKKMKIFHNFVKNCPIWEFSKLVSPWHCAKCPDTNKDSFLDFLTIALNGRKWLKSAKMDFWKSAHMSHWVYFLGLWYSFDQHWSLRIENSQIEPFLTKLWKFFIFWVLLLKMFLI